MMLPSHARRMAARRAAFTLLEVLVVVAILVILAGVASISVFKYMDQAKEGRAKADMQAIEKAYKTVYMSHSQWPQSPQDPQVTSLLDQGQSAVIDPWGQPYAATIQQQQQPDGTVVDRPVIFCQSPGREHLKYPDR